MRSEFLNLTIMIFCHILLASAFIYLNNFTEASPLSTQIDHDQVKPLQSANKEVISPIVKPSFLQENKQVKQSSVVIFDQQAASQENELHTNKRQVAGSVPQLAGKSSLMASKGFEVEPSSSSSNNKNKEQLIKEDKPAPVVVVAAAPATFDARSVLAEAQNKPSIVDYVANVPEQLVSQQQKESPQQVATNKSTEVPLENKFHKLNLAVVQAASVIEQAPIKPIDEPIKQEPFSKLVIVSQQASSNKEASPEVVEPIKVVQQAPVVNVVPSVSQPALLAVGGAEDNKPVDVAVVMGISENSKITKDYETKSIVHKDSDIAPAATAKGPVVVLKEAAPKSTKKLEELQQVQTKSTSVELPSEQFVGKKKTFISDTSAPVAPVVKGGLGPLQLLATTLCSYEPDKLVADECLNQLYARRANLRKSLLEFMSLKFTNLEKLSSRLGSGLQVVPLKTVSDLSSPANRASGSSSPPAPSHGWPVVGKCTAHDLKLMGEASWCEGEPGNVSVVQTQQAENNLVKEEESKQITSNQHVASSRAQAARSIGGPSSSSVSFLPSPEQSSVISKLLHVGDIKDAPIVESTIYNLNLTQQQLASLEAQATSTRECRRNALRFTKALFNHLAEDQRNTSESWPHLYALINTDDCARKRMIDIITALSSFRTDTTSIRRDNLEFAFAMDDLRTKVLEHEVNVPLTFDKQFIEVEQFLQQSVRLMLSNIDPNRAKLTSMRYRSLMYGTSNSDDQCIELHQRLLAQSYPTDCNPNQFGQLPDVLRMTASSLELWSIEKEISLRTGKTVDYPHLNLPGHQKVKENVNECIENLVSS